ncbi:MAG: trypsin-like peptidase domain-containing protein [Oscillospiraceae bacterium]|nr:trypsin-like peptidase domain-containing protein [Oscillospiraceae bacterium]
MSDFWNDNPNQGYENNQPNNTPTENTQENQSGSSYSYTPNPTPHYYTPSQPNNGAPQWNYSQYTSPSQPPKPPKRNRGLVVFTVLLCSLLLILMLCLAGVGIYAVVKGASNGGSLIEEVLPPAEVPLNPEENTTPDPSFPGLELELQDKPHEDNNIYISEDGRLTTTEVAKRVTPVTVSVIQYGSFQGQMSSGSGTGIIMSADGYVVTNAHVVTMSNGSVASAIEVLLADGARYEAVLVGADSRTDLAVLKIDATDLPYAVFGDSDQMEIGETVIAIGNPGGTELTSSVSQGIISGLNRLIKTSTDGYSINCLQTDAAINPGNSGGPLVNQYGQVIGINSAKLVDTQYEGIGFAIPINEAKPIIDQLIRHGRVTDRARLGITGIAITQSFSQYYGWPQGILIVTTEEGADISTKGLRAGEVGGDIITHINGIETPDLDSVAQILNNKKAGDQVELTIYRQPMQGQQASTFTVTITLVSDAYLN